MERVNEVIERLELDVEILDNDSKYKIKRLKDKLKRDIALDSDEQEELLEAQRKEEKKLQSGVLDIEFNE